MLNLIKKNTYASLFFLKNELTDNIEEIKEISWKYKDERNDYVIYFDDKKMVRYLKKKQKIF